MDKAELEQRTKAIALRVVPVVAVLPGDKDTDAQGY